MVLGKGFRQRVTWCNGAWARVWEAVEDFSRTLPPRTRSHVNILEGILYRSESA